MKLVDFYETSWKFSLHFVYIFVMISQKALSQMFDLEVGKFFKAELQFDKKFQKIDFL